MPRPRRSHSVKPQIMQFSIPSGVDKQTVEQNLAALAGELGLLYNGKPSKSALVVAIAQLPPESRALLADLLRQIIPPARA